MPRPRGIWVANDNQIATIRFSVMSGNMSRVSFQPGGCYRTYEMDANTTLYELAAYAMQSFNFDFGHAFGFYPMAGPNGISSSTTEYESFCDSGMPGTSENAKPTNVALVRHALKIGEYMDFLFDFGDEWHYAVELLSIKDAQPGVQYPRTIDSHGVAPPQYPEGDDEEEEDDEDDEEEEEEEDD